MKIRKTIAVTLLMGCMVSGTTAKTYYMAPNGSDANPGTQASPLATIARAQQLLAAGDTLLIRGGEYLIGANDIMSTQESIYACIFYFTKSGKAGKPICYFGYPGERPVFNLSRVKPAGKRVAGFYIHANYLHFRNFEVTGTQVTITTHTQSETFTIRRGNHHNTIENIAVHDGMGIGFVIWKGADNLILNCDAYNNYDPVSEHGSGENVDGFGCHVSDPKHTGNVFKGCRAWRNSDDGFDLITNYAPVTIDSCWAWENGYDANLVRRANGNGIKAGGYALRPINKEAPSNTISNCLAWRNPQNGFYANHHATGNKWYGNTAYNNGYNYDMLNQKSKTEATDVPGYDHVLKSNLSYHPRGRHYRNLNAAACTLENNSFLPSPLTLTADDFESLDASELSAPRKADGSLPDIRFLKVKKGRPAYQKRMGYQFDQATLTAIALPVATEAKTAQTDSRYYNLSGMVTPKTNGSISIHRGRKVVLK